MPRLKRSGKMETFSVSVSPETKARLRKAADRAYGGNVSALIEAIAQEADRQDALDWLLQRARPMDDRAFEVFMKEMKDPRRKRARRAA
jgi:post-segregation antitoxin (ccd killing protein)